MARGFMGGLVIGGLVSVAGAAVLSVIAFPPSQAPSPPSAEAPSQIATPVVGRAGGAPRSAPQDGTPQAIPQPPAPGPAPRTAAVPPDTTGPVQQPQTGEAAQVAPAPRPADGGAPTPALIGAPTPAPQPAQPQSPQTEAVAALDSAQPANPPAPQTGDAPQAVPAPTAPDASGRPVANVAAPQAAPSPAPVAAPEAGAGAQVALDTRPAAPKPAPAPAAEPEPEPQPTAAPAPEPATTPEPELAATPEPAATPELEPAATPEPESAATPEPEPAAQPEPEPAATPEPELAATPEPDPAPEATAEAPATEPEPTPETAPQSERPVLPTVTAQSGTATDTPRAGLPSIGRPATSLFNRPAETPAPAEETAEAEVAPDDSDLPALERYAVPFDPEESRPLMGIVLMDQGQALDGSAIGLAALGSFPYPLTFAVDATLPDAEDRMAQYRAQGFEVMALVDLPQSLTGADTEVALSAALSAVPEAVAVLEGPGTGLQGGRAISDQVAAILRDTGHGVVWRPNGLDTAQKLAARDGVASRTLFRDFDSEGQSPTTIRRFLDQAAFKAGQEGAVIMVGRIRVDTISALLLWGLQDRASRVAVAPVSAVLRAGLDR